MRIEDLNRDVEYLQELCTCKFQGHCTACLVKVDIRRVIDYFYNLREIVKTVLAGD